MFLDVIDSVLTPHNPRQPDDEVDAGEDGHKHEPEPEHHEDLLIKQVDVEHTLHCVLVQVSCEKCQKKHKRWLVKNFSAWIQKKETWPTDSWKKADKIKKKPIRKNKIMALKLFELHERFIDDTFAKESTQFEKTGSLVNLFSIGKIQN